MNNYERICIVCGSDAFLLFKEWFCRECAPAMTEVIRKNSNGKSIKEITQLVYDFIEQKRNSMSLTFAQLEEKVLQIFAVLSAHVDEFKAIKNDVVDIAKQVADIKSQQAKK